MIPAVQAQMAIRMVSISPMPMAKAVGMQQLLAIRMQQLMAIRMLQLMAIRMTQFAVERTQILVHAVRR